MMSRKSRFAQFVFAATVAICMTVGSSVATAAETAQANRPPAGQMCPGGSHVIGFDSESNIICSGTSESEAPLAGATAVDTDTGSGDDSPIKGQSGGGETQSAGKAMAAETVLKEPPDSSTNPDPVITDVDPKTALYGARQTAITVSGTGFNAGSVIIFAGKRYSPSVNQAGTRLDVTIPTRDLSMGRYAITVSNGPGKETTRKKALEIF